MLKEIAVLLLLSGCSTVMSSKAANTATDLCNVEKRPNSGEVRVIAVAETDGQHGLFLSSQKCRFKLRIGKTPEQADRSVDQFLSHVSSGSHLTWRKYSGEFLGRVVVENAKVRFELLHVYWFRDASSESQQSEVSKPLP